MKGSGVASVGRLMICCQIFKTAARYNSKCGVARHRRIQSQGRLGRFVLRRDSPWSGFTGWFRGPRHCCSAPLHL